MRALETGYRLTSSLSLFCTVHDREVVISSLRSIMVYLKLISDTETYIPFLPRYILSLVPTVIWDSEGLRIFGSVCYMELLPLYISPMVHCVLAVRLISRRYMCDVDPRPFLRREGNYPIFRVLIEPRTLRSLRSN